MRAKHTEIQNYLKNYVFREADESPSSAGRGKTLIEPFEIAGIKTVKYINEFWTSRQRKSSSIHEISYRACFKAQLPGFFIELFTGPGDTVYDPFSGRGTTVIEAALSGRKVISNDINPLSRILTYPRLSLPETERIYERVDSIPFDSSLEADTDLSMFYHRDTGAEIVSIRNYLKERKAKGLEDDSDEWIRMIATNRLTGHSPGFFSVYTLPPNQAVLPESQIKINQKRNQKPEYRDTKKIIKRKTVSLMKRLKLEEKQNLRKASESALFLESDAGKTGGIKNGQVDLTVTSPPFLDIVQYSKDNWLRCWFNGIDTLKTEKQITMSATVEEWVSVMQEVFHELYRITKIGGWVVFEVGEVRKGRINLEEYVIPIGINSGFSCFGVIVNLQEFTKTSNIWGIKNNNLGTNTNRMVLFYKD